MNPLNAYPRVRQVAYVLSVVVGLCLGAAQVGYAAAESGLPTWLKVALAVYAFVAAGLGLTAAQNVPSVRDVVEGDVPPPVERGESLLLVVLAVLVVAAVLFAVLR